MSRNISILAITFRKRFDFKMKMFGKKENDSPQNQNEHVWKERK
eukprot:UN03552